MGISDQYTPWKDGGISRLPAFLPKKNLVLMILRSSWQRKRKKKLWSHQAKPCSALGYSGICGAPGLKHRPSIGGRLDRPNFWKEWRLLVSHLLQRSDQRRHDIQCRTARLNFTQGHIGGAYLYLHDLWIRLLANNFNTHGTFEVKRDNPTDVDMSGVERCSSFVTIVGRFVTVTGGKGRCPICHLGVLAVLRRWRQRDDLWWCYVLPFWVRAGCWHVGGLFG